MLLTKKLFWKQLICPKWRKFYGTNSRCSSFLAIKLSNRKVIRVCGPDSIIYLQSLITNDIRHLLPFENLERKSSLYAYMLNANGRVMCDLFLYCGKVMSEGELLMEINSSLATAMKRLLWGHSIRRKISVEIADEIDVWTLIPRYKEAVESLQEIVSDDLCLVKDPRLPHIGYRFMTRLGAKTLQDLNKYINVPLEQGKLTQYQKYRYQLGVNEGIEDTPSGFHYPFECNGDYLNAVSISKGLYCAEELNAKVYSGLSTISSKGRNRIMPIEFLCDSQTIKNSILPPKTYIFSGDPNQNFDDNKFANKQVGLLLNSVGTYGLAVFNCKKIFYETDLYHGQSKVKLKTWKPNWWPHDVRPFLTQKQSLLQHYFPDA